MRRGSDFKWIALAASVMAIASRLVVAGPEPVLSVTGEVPNPQRYSREELQKLPVAKVTARDHDGTNAEYTGVMVEELLRRAGAPLGEHLRGRALAMAVVIHGADGYQVVFSLAELDSGMAERDVLLAWKRNDEALPASQGPLRLVVPGEKRQARWVRQVTAIEVVPVNRPAITNAAALPTTPPGKGY